MFIVINIGISGSIPLAMARLLGGFLGPRKFFLEPGLSSEWMGKYGTHNVCDHIYNLCNVQFITSIRLFVMRWSHECWNMHLNLGQVV